MTSIRVGIFAVTLATLFGFAATATNAEEGIDEIKNEWSFKLTPYAWFIGLDGDVTVKGRTASPSITFSEIFDELNYGVMLEGEARKGRWSGFFNTVFADLGKDENVGPLNIDPDIKVWWQEFGVFYRFGPWKLSDSADGKSPTLFIDPYVGGRYTYLDVDIKIKGNFGIIDTEVSGDEDWIEPLIGVRTIWNLSERWSIVAAGNVGGFGIGSDFAWGALGLAGYKFELFGKAARANFGYRAMSQDYSTGSGADKFEWDMTLHGPILALTIEF